MTVGISTSDENTVLLDDTETWSGLACSSQRSLPAMRAEDAHKRRALGRDAGAAGENVQPNALTEEDLADGSSNGSALFNGFDGLAFLDVPFDAEGGQFQYKFEKSIISYTL
jgi:hypothetical protein